MASIRDSLFGTLAERAGFAAREQVEECVALQEEYRSRGGRVPRLGELLAQKGYMTAEQVRSVLRGQHAAQEGLFGETAVRLAFTTRERVRESLDAQRPEGKRKLGQLLVEKGYLTSAQVHSVLEAQNKRLVGCPGCGKRMNVAGLVPGKQVTCPGCGRVSPAAEVRLAPRGELAAEFELEAQEPPAEKKVEIGGYEILTRLGSDGTGAYCKARHLHSGAVCALKIMSSQAMSDKAFVKRFIEDGKRGTGLQHKNIKKLYEVGVDKGRYYFSTEFVEGASLRRVLEGGKRLPLQQTIDVGIKSGEALEYAHSRGVLHGDVRPSNIIIAEDGTLKLAALGLAKDVGANLRHFARSKEVTAFYLAPEQALDDTRVDERTDVYSLGATLYHMATGRPPYEGDSPLEILMRMSEEELPPPEEIEPRVPLELSQVIMKMLADEPGRRHQSMAECLAELRQVREVVASAKATYATGKRPPVTAAPRRDKTAKIPKTPRLRRSLATVGSGDREAVGTSPRITGPRPAQSRKGLLVLVGVVALAGGALAILWLLTDPAASYGEQYREARREKERELQQEEEVETDETPRVSEIAVSEEFRAAMQFALKNEDSPEAVERLERFIERHPDSLHSPTVRERLGQVKLHQAASQLASISNRAADPAGRFTELIAELDSWLEHNPAHMHAGAARSLKARLEEAEAAAFRSAMAKVDALWAEGDWEGALAELGRAAADFREPFATRAREKKKEIEAARKKLAREEEARLARERAEAERRRREAGAREALARAWQSALGELREFDFDRAREALTEARASVRGTTLEKDLEHLLAGVDLAKGALASLGPRFRPGSGLKVTRGGTRAPVSAVGERGVTVTIRTQGKELSTRIPWKRLSAYDLYSALSALADWNDPDYLVGAGLLCTASKEPSYARRFLASAAKRRDVSLYEKLLARAMAPAPEEAPPRPKPAPAPVPEPVVEEAPPEPAGGQVLDLSSLEEMGGQWESQDRKLVGADGSLRTRVTGLERISGVFIFSELEGSAEVTAGKWSLRFVLARKELAFGAGGGGGGAKTMEFPASINTPYAWSISLERGEAVFRVGARELARFPSAPQDGQLWFTLITRFPVTIADVKLKQSGRGTPGTKPAPKAPGSAAPAPPVTPSATGVDLAGWKVGQGEWKVDEAGVLTGSADVGLAWASRPISKPFVIEVELEGRAQMAGISFGEAKEFLVVPAGGKQSLRLEVKDSVRFLVDGVETQSAGHSMRAKRPASIGDEFRLEVKVGRVSFKVKIEEGG